ncbi:MAG: hypothetical protein ABJF86_17670 [Tateyamaria sp.]|uniref:hypothetical protein n=1 Tax=Tateyamaria sp. TaxID=1929288 RepID=UPI003273B970
MTHMANTSQGISQIRAYCRCMQWMPPPDRPGAEVIFELPGMTLDTAVEEKPPLRRA